MDIELEDDKQFISNTPRTRLSVYMFLTDSIFAFRLIMKRCGYEMNVTPALDLLQKLSWFTRIALLHFFTVNGCNSMVSAIFFFRRRQFV